MVLGSSNIGFYCEFFKPHLTLYDCNKFAMDGGALVMKILFKWKRYQSEIIILYVYWYLKDTLSYRKLQEAMQERGINISHTTVCR